MEDTIFRTKLRREPEDAVTERGFALSGMGLQLLIEFSQETLPEFPVTCRPSRYN